MGRRCRYGVKRRQFDGSEIQRKLELFKKIRTEKNVPVNKVSDSDFIKKYELEDPESHWIIVELSEDTSLEDHADSIERSLQSVLGKDARYFIPIYKEKVRGKNICMILSEGWIYVKRTEEIMKDIFKLKGDHIRGPFISGGYLREVTGEHINLWKKELENRINKIVPEVGQIVVPQVGTFRNVKGEVIAVNKKKLVATVLFKKSSRIVKAPVNIINLVFSDEDPDTE